MDGILDRNNIKIFREEKSARGFHLIYEFCIYHPIQLCSFRLNLLHPKSLLLQYLYNLIQIFSLFITTLRYCGFSA